MTSNSVTTPTCGALTVNIPAVGINKPGSLALRVTSPQMAKVTKANAMVKDTPVTHAKLGGRAMRMLPSHWDWLACITSCLNRLPPLDISNPAIFFVAYGHFLGRLNFGMNGDSKGTKGQKKTINQKSVPLVMIREFGICVS
ncbi:hypothetical protein [Paucibacter sp. KCTC 42545]|uniref:hypothetical protein n=1 Tax=Paucibacter sp. KCTC 42545 TaxID=1768242 RepID=UPI0018D26CDF|nr:hypothetical protein [Paucibacter sp. KCTC 42545]